MINKQTLKNLIKNQEQKRVENYYLLLMIVKALNIQILDKIHKWNN